MSAYASILTGSLFIDFREEKKKEEVQEEEVGQWKWGERETDRLTDR